MTDKEFMELYPDTENQLLSEAIGKTRYTVLYRAKKLGLRKSDMYSRVFGRKVGTLSMMRGIEEWRSEYKELKSLAVCLENYARIDHLCDLFQSRKTVTEKEIIMEYTEENINKRLGEIQKRYMEIDCLSDEAKRLVEEQKDLTARLYALRHDERRDVPFTQADYVFYK